MVTTDTSGRWLSAIALTGCLLCSVHAADGPTALTRAAKSVERARRGLQRARTPAEILSVLDAAATHLEAVAAPSRPTLAPVDPEGGEAESVRTGEENKRRLREWRRACDAHRRSSERLRSRWVRLLGKALILRRTEGGSLDNVHDAVNRHALTLLIETGRDDAAHIITTALEKEWLRPSRMDLDDPFAMHALDQVFQMHSPVIYDWLRRTFVGKERPLITSVPTNHMARARHRDLHPHDVPVQALLAIAQHREMPGDVRYNMVRDLLKAYAPLERRAAQGVDVDRWARMRAAVLMATVYQAGEPKDEAGNALITMAAVAGWFRKHRNPLAAPWTD